MSQTDFASELRKTRKARNESQQRFWARFGVTQSRGSRFELGNDIPSPVAILLRLYFDGVISDGDLWRARRKRMKPAKAGAAPDAGPSPRLPGGW
ncbi:MAG: helix-turn-helix transcriptional regulator [Pseudomonadota bacterium]